MLSQPESLPSNLELKKLKGIKVGFPDVETNITFLHTSHTHREDLPKDIERILDNTDVVLLEGYAPHPESSDIDQAISDGSEEALNDYRNYFNDGSDFSIALREAFFGLEKPIVSCDVPYGKKTEQAVGQREKLLESAFASQSLAEFVRRGRAFFDHSIQEFSFSRDKYFLRNVYSELTSPFVDEVLPERIDGLFVLGAMHKTVPCAIRRQVELQGLDNHTVSEMFVGDTRDPLADMYYDFLQGKRYDDVDVLKAFLVAQAALQGVSKNEILNMTFDEAASATISTQ